jgi:DNA adenine methylase
MIRSPLRYPGGKSKAVKFLAQFVPKDFKEFREPMFGGGSLTLYLAQLYPDRRFVGGDLNLDLYCFWKSLKEQPKELIREIRKFKENFHDGRELFNLLISARDKKKSCLQRGAEFFVLNRITFSGTVDSGGYSEQAFKKRFTESSIERLEKVYPILQRIEFFHGDYAELLHKEGEKVVIYLDPPYYGNKKSRLYGKRGSLHFEFDHLRLLEEIKKTPHRVLITYDDNEFIRELYKDFYIVEWNLKYGMSSFTGKNKKATELLIANFPLVKKTLISLSTA